METTPQTRTPMQATASAIVAVVAWYITNFVMNLLNVVFFVNRDGGKVDFARLQYSKLWGDRVGWGHYVGPWLSLAIPAIVVLTLACLRLEFSWKLARQIGLALVAAQIVVMMIRGINLHSPPFAPDYLIYYVARFWVVLPGVFAAAAAWRINLRAEIASAW